MKAMILYHPQSEQAGAVDDYTYEYKKEKHTDIKKISLESLEGDKIARLYDVVVYPSLLVVRNDGQLMKMWQGALPQKNQVEAYLKT